jgi:Fe-S cluster biogenesis protein NfuA
MLLRKRRHRAQQEKTEQNIRLALDLIRPILRIDECELSLENFDIDTGTAVLAINGTCTECELTAGTFIDGIEAQIKIRVPEVTSVRIA